MGGLFREKPGVEIFRHIQERDLSGLRRVLARSRAAARAHHPNGAAGLHLACVDGWLDGVKELISAGADVSEVDPVFGATPLHMAVRKGHVEVIRELLRCNADLSKRHKHGHTPLMSAVEQKNPAVVKMLLEAGPNPIEALNGLDILAWGILTWKVLEPPEVPPTVAVAGHLIDTFARINQQFAKGWNALMFAVAHLQSGTVRLLLARGADATLKNSDGAKPLSLATDLLAELGKGPLTGQCEDIIAQLRRAS